MHIDEDEEDCPECNPERITTIYRTRYWLPSIAVELFEELFGDIALFFRKVSRHLDAMGQEDLEKRVARSMQETLNVLGETDAY